ncbi:MAG: TetR/AcrR family transcriptional regulator [Clostridiales bacterium]|nr:TetR/AcrR family transcriptional regulator [Clostridiales bacterium]
MSIHDARARYTRMVIREQFLALLKEKPAAKITVKELCAACDINRATFYKHYRDIFDLMEQLERQLLQELDTLLESQHNRNLVALYVQILTWLEPHGDDWLVLGSGNGDPSFYEKMSRRCCERTYPWLARQQSKLREPEQRMLYAFLSQGTGGILHAWVRGGMQEPVTQVAEFLACATEQLINGLAAQQDQPD